MRKSDRHEAVRERARAALRDLYHNATPSYPSLEGRELEHFGSWFPDAAQFEIEYIQSGGAYGDNYRKTLSAACNAGRYTSEAARAYYIQKGMRDMRAEREHCGTRADGTPNNALWEYIGEYGTLYQYGRGGRTLAPKDLIRTGGGSSFSIRKDYADDMPLASCVNLIRILESFNRHVTDWCDSVPEQWREYWREYQQEERRAKREARIRRDVQQAFVGCTCELES